MANTKAVRSMPKNTARPKNVAEYVTWQINLCGKKQTEIAEEIGFDKPNVITMIKQGKTKVPINKIGKLAKSLGVDPIFFMKMCITEYMPDMMEAIIAITNQPVISANELDFIKEIRKSKVINPKLRTATEKQKLLDFVNSLKADNETRD